MAVNWALGLQQGPDAGQAFAQSFQAGIAQRQQQARQLLQQHREGIVAAGKIIREIQRQNPNMPHDQVYAMARQTAIQMGVPGADQAPPQYDERYYQGILTAANAFDPQTGGDGFTLSPGQVRYGANGQVIANGGPERPRYYAVPPGGQLQLDPSYAGAVPQNGPIAAPPVGQIEEGFRFKGGNPADPNSWEPVGGQTVVPSGTFQP